MVERNLRPKARIQSMVAMAVAAVERDANPLDGDLAGVDTDPTTLDLDDATELAACHHRYVCADCGAPLCGDAS